MSEYPSIYRAKSTRWTGGVLHTLIPQIFGEAEVDINTFLNEPSVGMGWVMFQGGDAEHPVWLGPLNTTVEGGDGTGEVPASRRIDTTLPLRGGGSLAADRTLSIDLFSAGTKGAVPPPGSVSGRYLKDDGTWATVSGGTGTDEVWIGPDDPTATNPTIELWYDTDDEPAAADQANFWNSAWGHVYTTAPLADATYPSSTKPTVASMNVTLVSGRRYRFTLFMRAYAAADALPQALNTYFYVDGVVNGPDPWMASAGQWDNGTVTYIKSVPTDIAPGAHTIDVQIQMGNRNVQFWGNGSYWMCEDIGPVMKAAVNPPAGQPTMVTAGNALGIVAMGSPRAGSVDIANNVWAPIFNTLSVNLALGRRYRAVVGSRAIGTSGPGNAAWRLLDNGALNVDRFVLMGNGFNNLYQEQILNGDGATHVLGVEFQPNAPVGPVTVYTDYGWLWYVEDIGPNSAPALPIPETAPGWTDLTLNAGWVVDPGALFQRPQYRKIGDEVTLRGQAQYMGQGIGIMFTLPVGFRPPRSLRVGVHCHKVNVGGLSTARCDINTTGTFLVNEIVAPVITDPVMYLNDICFSVTA